MTTVVCFRAGDDDYAVAVEHVREVRSGDAIRTLPASRNGVVGLLQLGDEAFPVIEAFGSGNHVLLLDGVKRAFGLVVNEVTRVVTLDNEIAPPPPGQDGCLISGVISTDAGIALLVDVAALDDWLGP